MSADPYVPTVADAKLHLLRQILGADVDSMPDRMRAAADAYEALVRAELLEREHAPRPPTLDPIAADRLYRDGPCRTCGALPGGKVPGARTDFTCRACGARGTGDGVSPR